MTNQQIAAAVTIKDFNPFNVLTHEDRSKKKYRDFKKLTSEQIDKFFKAAELIGFECQYQRGSKIRQCVIVAVTLPKKLVVVLPTGVMNTHYQMEFANIYFNTPFNYRVSLLNEKGESTDEFWSDKIDNLYLDNSTKRHNYPTFFETLEEAKQKYIG